MPLGNCLELLVWSALKGSVGYRHKLPPPTGGRQLQYCPLGDSDQAAGQNPGNLLEGREKGCPCFPPSRRFGHGCLSLAVIHHRVTRLLSLVSFSFLPWIDIDSEPEFPPAQPMPRHNKLNKTWQAQAPGHSHGASSGLPQSCLPCCIRGPVF